jgi:hypothetical protein
VGVGVGVGVGLSGIVPNDFAATELPARSNTCLSTTLTSLACPAGGTGNEYVAVTEPSGWVALETNVAGTSSAPPVITRSPSPIVPASMPLPSRSSV